MHLEEPQDRMEDIDQTLIYNNSQPKKAEMWKQCKPSVKQKPELSGNWKNNQVLSAVT